MVNGCSIAVFQTFFDAHSSKKITPGCIPLYVPETDRFFENSIILELVKGNGHQIADYIGIFSWRFFDKIPLPLPEIIQRMDADRFSAPIYSFFGGLKHTAIWSNAEIKHPGIQQATQCLFSRLGLELDLARLEAPVIYQNHFLCRPEVLHAYCNEMLEPAVKMMRDRADTELQTLLSQDASYHDPSKSTAQMRQLFGHKYPMLHPFICERLFSTWLTFNRQYTVKQIWSGRFIEPQESYLDHEARTISLQNNMNSESSQSTTHSTAGISVISSIVVTTYGQETWYTQMCLQRIAEWRKSYHELIVVFHDESALLRAYLEYMKAEGVIDVLLPAQSAHGHVRGVNLGMQHARGKYVVNLCIDVLLGPGVVDECIKRLQGNPALGAVGWHYPWAASYPGSYWIGDRLYFSTRPVEKDMDCREGDDLLESYVAAIRESRWFSGKLFNAIGPKRILCFNGSFFCLRHDLWNRIGGFDVSRFPHSWADDLLCYAVLDCGFSVANINPAFGSTENPDYFREFNEYKWQGFHDADRHRDDISWIPWFTAIGLTVSELVLIDLVIGALDSEARIASIGEFEQFAGFVSLKIERFLLEQDILNEPPGFDLILCGNIQRLEEMKQWLTRHGVLLVFPPFELNSGLQQHGNLGIYFNTPKRLYFDCDKEFNSVEPTPGPR